MRSAGGVGFLGVIQRADLHKWTTGSGSDRKRWDLRFSLTARGTAWVTGQRGPAQLVPSRVGDLDAVKTVGKFPGTCQSVKRVRISGSVCELGLAWEGTGC